jgi:hypothetical protein
VAETTLPPVRGPRRLRVLVVLGLSSAAAAAAVGVLAGLVGVALGGPPPGVIVVGVVIAAAGADVARARWGRPVPWSVGRQVPVAWSRLFEPEVAAALYGLRLGVGPLTILSSWLWWAAFAIGASAGPVAGAVAGVAFALARTTVTAAVASTGAADGTTMAHRVRGLARIEGRVAVVAAASIVVAAAALAACGGSDDDARSDGPAAAGVVGTGVTAVDPAPDAATAATRGTGPGEPSSTTSAPTAGPTTTALEPTTTAPPLTDLLPDLTTSLALELPVDDLPALLVPTGPAGFTQLPEGQLGAGPLDLDAAAAAEPDVAAERSLLVTRGFVAGHARAWEDGQGATALAVVYRFATADGAGAYLLDGGEHALARGAEPFGVPIDGAFGFSQVDDTGSSPFVVHAVVMVRGPVFALVLVGSPDGAQGPDVARDLAVAQAAVLEAAAG